MTFWTPSFLDCSKFVASQNYYSIASRDIEREIVPMALGEGIGIMRWSPFAGGFLSGKYRRDNQVAGENSCRDTFDFPPIDKEKAYHIIDLMIEIGNRHNVSSALVALAWVVNQPWGNKRYYRSQKTRSAS